MTLQDILSIPSPNFDDRPPDARIDLIVLHYTGMQDGAAALARLTDPTPVAGRYPGPWQDPAMDPATALPRVSAHYVIEEDGRIFTLVPEEKRAWHAGASHWRGRDNVNASAIGIELVNGGHDFRLPGFAHAQIERLIALLRDIQNRRRLSPACVVGHSDVAPHRKRDPGEKFPWERLEAAGVALGVEVSERGDAPVLSPGDSGDAVAGVQYTLAEVGYGIEVTRDYDAATKAVIEAFQRRRRPRRVTGVFDLETSDLLDAVLDKTRQLQHSSLSISS
jgi:N-acetylmuramoyl-L-alanine amidase